MREQGRLCEAGGCVEPWEYGSPEWSRVEDDPYATTESLAEKAENYEEITKRLHLHPELKWVMGVNLPPMQVECPAGENPPCYDNGRPAVSLEKATWKDVVSWRTGENDGLWNALYIAAEGYRYAVTRDPAVLDLIKTLLESQVLRMEVTGVSGIYTRQYIPAGYEGISCPENPSYYRVDAEKTSNKWVKIRDDGCVWTVDQDSGEWRKSDHCGLERFADWCWLDNVSKDEYAGHVLALGVLSKLVDDPGVQEVVRDQLSRIAYHLMKNRMAFTDWDGRVAEHGRIYAVTFGDYPGFNAAMALDYIKVAAEATGDPKIEKWYRDCLLQKSGRINCVRQKFEKPLPYTKYLKNPGLFPGKEGCKANYNNTSMHMCSLQNLIWYEHDPELREIYQAHLDKDVFRAPGQPRALQFQNNAWFDFIWAANKKLGPDSDGPAYEAVENGIRMLRQFPARKYLQERDCPEDVCVPYCDNRFGAPCLGFARETKDRCVHHFLWWGDPYRIQSCGKRETFVQVPADYLLAYWMGRYFGFIDEDM